MPRVGKKHFPYTPAGVKAAGKLKKKISSRAASGSAKPAAIKAPAGRGRSLAPSVAGKAGGPSPRAMERANANASFKRTASPSAKAPGQMKKMAAAGPAKSRFAQMMPKASSAIKAPTLSTPSILSGGMEKMPRVR